MSTESFTKTASEGAEQARTAEGTESPDVPSTLARLESLIGRFAATADIRASLGEARQVGEHTVIPVAVVSLQTGFGGGFGKSEGADGAKSPPGSGGGGGGGGSASSRVIAVIDVGPEGVKVRPVIDVNGLVRSAMAASIGFVFMRAALRRFSRR